MISRGDYGEVVISIDSEICPSITLTRRQPQVGLALPRLSFVSWGWLSIQMVFYILAIIT